MTTGAIGLIVIVAGIATAAIFDPALVRPLIPLALSAGLLLGLGTHGAARRAARRHEVERSFAGLTVVHNKERFAVGARPILGEYGTRRLAARAALDRGGWAIVVHAWDRYFLLACEPASAASPTRTPVSFRSRAVADVVPAIRDDVALGA